MLHVPMDALQFDVEGAVFTGKTQVTWIGQLTGLAKKILLKHKEAYARSVLAT